MYLLSNESYYYLSLDNKPVDCQAYFAAGNDESGIYTIYPQSDMYPDGYKVYCDMRWPGWIVSELLSYHFRSVNHH